MSSKYKDSMNKIAMDEDMKNRIIVNLKNMQVEDNIEDINSIDEMKKSKSSGSRLKLVRNLGMYAACFAVVLGGMAIKPFMSVPNLDKNNNADNVVENSIDSENLENNSYINGSDMGSSESSGEGRTEGNEGFGEKASNEYSSNEDQKVRSRSGENAGRGTSNGADVGIGKSNGAEDSMNNSGNAGTSYTGTYDSAGSDKSENDNSGSHSYSSASGSTENVGGNAGNSGIDADNSSRGNSNSNVSNEPGNEAGLSDKNSIVNNANSDLKNSEISPSSLNDNIEGRNSEVSFNNLSDLKEKADFDFKVSEVLENNYSKSEISLVLNEIIDITYTKNDDSIEFKTCKGKKDISGFDVYENDKNIKVDDVNFNLKGNGNSVKSVSWYDENMSYSIQSTKGMTSNEALEIAESLKTFK